MKKHNNFESSQAARIPCPNKVVRTQHSITTITKNMQNDIQTRTNITKDRHVNTQNIRIASSINQHHLFMHANYQGNTWNYQVLSKETTWKKIAIIGIETDLQ